MAKYNPGRVRNAFSGVVFYAAACFLLPALSLLSEIVTAEAAGPLRVSTVNPRYFADGDGNIVYLTGSHTWSNLQDPVAVPPSVFDFNAYLDFLVAQRHNFFRLWAWESPKAIYTQYPIAPMPFQRPGPGNALDGKPKFDVTAFDQSYFDRMRNRIVAAGKHGIYASVMLFNGFSMEPNKGGNSFDPWIAHPFNKSNNINGINGDPNNDASGYEVHTLQIPSITAIQEAYVRKVIDTVNDLDNVLYEISNESHSGSTQWQYHMINFIKDYERSKPRQHPVGMTSQYPGGDNATLFASPADWISPNQGSGNYYNDPLASDGTKVILSDTDHLCGICGDRYWAWKSFLRGMNPLFMDAYHGPGSGYSGWKFDDPQWVSLRSNLGHTLIFAKRINLAGMLPRNELSSTRYCLSNAGAAAPQYLVYLPAGGTATVNLTAASGELAVEWFNPATGLAILGGTTQGGARRSFTAPFSGDAVLYVRDQQCGASEISRGNILLRGNPNTDSFNIDQLTECAGLSDATAGLRAKNVHIEIGAYTADIPGTYFVLRRNGYYEYPIKPRVGKVLKIIINPGTESIYLYGSNLNLHPIENPITVRVAIGGQCFEKTDNWTMTAAGADTDYQLP
jgi:hypothetical protein